MNGVRVSVETDLSSICCTIEIKKKSEYILYENKRQIAMRQCGEKKARREVCVDIEKSQGYSKREIHALVLGGGLESRLHENPQSHLLLEACSSNCVLAFETYPNIQTCLFTTSKQDHITLFEMC